MIKCAVCNEEFTNDKSLHAHLKKHELYQAEYYCKYYPRYSLFYKKQIPYKNKKEYFKTEFLDVQEFLLWEKNEKQEIVKQKILEMLQARIKEKEYQYAPFLNELISLNLPSINIYKKYFGSYNSACQAIGLEPLFNKNIPKDFNNVDLSDIEVIVDTREQDPLEFKNIKIEKLFVGDYLLNKKEYSYTFVDRKAESDFLGTMTSGLSRFEREIEKAVGLDGYLFVVIESNISKIKYNHKKFHRKTSLEYVFHNMRYLSHKYARRIQFIFTGDRDKSLDIIPKLLYHGGKLWQVDLQYFLDNELGIGEPDRKKIEIHQQ